jgi:(p)ppGpp synthase/HD superfamily hydrolase
MRMSELARAYAQAAHRAVGQKRKYTGECYTIHTCEVAQLVQEYGSTEDMICAAHLHDVVEDTGVTIDDVRGMFGCGVADLVGWVTDVSTPEDGNRKARKAKDRDHLAQAPAEAQTIKCCDLISNTGSIVASDPSFSKVYLAEKRELLAVMTKANFAAHAAAVSIAAKEQDNG